jgi:hypothetical protein
MDCDANALVFRTALQRPDDSLESVLREAFPGRDIRRLASSSDSSGLSYQVRFALPLNLVEMRAMVGEIRKALLRLLARFEPVRYRALQEVLETFGTRDTLARVHIREPRSTAMPVSSLDHAVPKRVH